MATRALVFDQGIGISVGSRNGPRGGLNNRKLGTVLAIYILVDITKGVNHDIDSKCIFLPKYFFPF
jgi:nicotinamide mononucleotide (NMN) deamidase PncC